MAVIEPQDFPKNAFELLRPNRFLLKNDIIPSFLVKEVVRPPIDNSSFGHLIIRLYNAVHPSVNQIVAFNFYCGYDLDPTKKTDFIFQDLGPVGDVVGETLYEGWNLYRVDYPKSDINCDKETDHYVTLYFGSGVTKIVF